MKITKGIIVKLCIMLVCFALIYLMLNFNEVDLIFFERILISYLEYTDSNGPQHLDYSIMKLK